MNPLDFRGAYDEIDPFSIKVRNSQLLTYLNSLTNHHKLNCAPYSNMVDLFFGPATKYKKLEDIPYIPVRAFKEIDLYSINENEIFKIMRSSGTSGQKPSKIFIDRDTSVNQVRALSRIMSNFFGSSRLPMLIVDSKETISDRKNFNARAAGILGFSMFGSEIFYALNNDNSINLEAISLFNEKCKTTHGLVFGFTSIIWRNLIIPLERQETEFQLLGSSLLHGGGWKNLLEEGISNDFFKSEIFSKLGISNVVNYYGMIEQTGSIFMECQYGFLHSSVYSNVIIRDHRNFESLPDGNWGLIQLQSLLPTSYPGHSILTEDVGMIYPGSECDCGRLGKRIAVRGRVPKAEIRGCSDTHEF